MKTIPDPARQRAMLTPDKPAFIDAATGAVTTFAEVDDHAERFASVLDDLGLAAGDRVAILCLNTPVFFEILFAAAKAGLILVPLNWRQPPAELMPILADSGARLLLTDAAQADLAEAIATGTAVTVRDLTALREKADAAPKRPRETCWPTDRVWYLLYTSGTTGRPKAVIQTPGMMWANAVNVAEATRLSDRDVSINFLPLFHTAGINLHTLPIFLFGGTSHVLAKFDLDRTLDLLSDGTISVFFGVPAVYQAISLSSRFDTLDFSRVRHWGCGGAPLPEPLIRQLQARSILVCNGMGMTETGPTVFFVDPDHAATKVGSVGKPRILTEVRLVDAAGMDVAAGAQGEILFRGPGITPGYYGNPDATRAAFTPDGWLRSGDVGRRDADGYYFIVDRIKDMYISGGENVYPAEVEAVLNAHPAVLEAVVLGVADPRWGEAGHALLRLRPGKSTDTDEIRRYARDKLAAYKVPRDVTFVDDYPRTAAGKVQKHVLRASLPEGQR